MNNSSNTSNRLVSAGFLLVDKPKGVTSHDVVAACRAQLHTRHVGHAGTLDPMASGLLVIGFGAATRLLKYVVGKTKTYETVVRLGAATTTDDAEGEFLTASQPPKITQLVAEVSQPQAIADIKNLLKERFSGDIEQVPSAYSAIKVKGQRAYELARAGKMVELKPRTVTIEECTLLDANSVEEGSSQYLDLHLRIVCSAGTYIRAIGRDLGAALGTGGYLTFLRRTRIGNFEVTDAIKSTTQERVFTDKAGVEQHRLRAILNSADVAQKSVDVASVIGDFMPILEVNGEQARELNYGRPIDADISAPTASVYRDSSGQARLCAIVEPGRSHGMARPTAVFPSESPTPEHTQRATQGTEE